MRRLLSRLSTVFAGPSDEYWDQKATELTYLGKLHRGELELEQSRPGQSLQERAVTAVGPVNFTELLAELEVDTGYRTLTAAQISGAVGIGIAGVVSAYLTNLHADKLEELFLKLHEYFKPEGTTSPLDYRTGAKHRYIFGHDLNVFQKLPDDYTFGGESVGGKTLYSLVVDYIEAGYPGAGPVLKHLKAIAHILTHCLSDLPTKDGLPLPFSSLFTQWVKDESKASGYSASNPLMDALGREFGTINAADISSYATIKLLLSGRHAIAFYKSEVTQEDKDLHLALMSTIAYGTGLMIQMLLLVAGAGGRTGKMNYLIAGPFLWNAGKSTLITHRQHQRVVMDYERSIRLLDDKTTTFDDWIRVQCQ